MRPRRIEAGETRKEIEGVFLAERRPRRVHAVKTGIAGDTLLAVLEGLKEATKSSSARLRPRARSRTAMK
jgi:hypothetical protein